MLQKSPVAVVGFCADSSVELAAEGYWIFPRDLALDVKMGLGTTVRNQQAFISCKLADTATRRVLLTID